MFIAIEGRSIFDSRGGNLLFSLLNTPSCAGPVILILVLIEWAICMVLYNTVCSQAVALERPFIAVYTVGTS